MRVLDLVRAVRTVTDLPNFGDERATREWLSGVIATAWAMPSNSTNEIVDDDAMSFLWGLACSKQSFDSLYRLLVVCLTTSRALTVEEAALAMPLIAERSKAAGVKPETVLTVVEGIASMVQFVRDAASRSSTY
jgi:hypothetical protein